MLLRADPPSIWTRAFARPSLTLLVLAAMLVSTLPYSLAQVRLPAIPNAQRSQPPTTDLSKLPLAFEPAGQSAALYTVHQPGATLDFSNSRVVFSPASGQANSGVSLNFAGSSPSATLLAGEALPGKANYLLGNDPTRWRTNVSTFSDILYSGLYKGIDLRYSGTPGHLAGAYTIAPAARPALIAWRYAGAATSIDSAGNLRIAGEGSALDPQVSLRMPPPTAWQEIGGKRLPISVAYSLSPGGLVSFTLGAYDVSRPLTIQATWVYPAGNSRPAARAAAPSSEPNSLAYSTYLGGSETDYGLSIATDPQGFIYVTGYTRSSDFPTANALQPVSGAPREAFVTKLSPDGSTLIYSTYLGGNGYDEGHGIVADAAGNAYVAGVTLSNNFPVAHAIQPASGGASDMFICELNPTGSALVFSTYYGGNSLDVAEGIARDPAGNIYIGGVNDGGHFPVVNPYQPVEGGTEDSILMKLNPAGSAVIYATYMGGAAGSGGNYDHAFAIAVDSAGSAYLTGFTGSTDFPLVNAFQPALAGAFDSYVTKFSPDGRSLVYSTYLGGISGEEGHGIAVDSTGSAYVTGYTFSPNFPTLNAFQTTNAGAGDAYVTKFNPDGSSLAYSTFLGGRDFDYAKAIAIDASGAAYIAGQTGSNNYPTLHPIQPVIQGNSDVLVTKLNPSGAALEYSTYLGGTNYDDGYGIAVAGTTAYVTGYARSPNYPTANPIQPNNAGAEDAFVSVIAGLTSATATPTAIPTGVPTGVPTGTPTTPPANTATNTPTKTPTAPASTPTLPANTPTVVPTQCAASFTDVQQTDYFYEAVRYLYCHGAISGYADNTFRPGNLTTRGQLSKIVVLAEGWTIYTPTAPTFSDVDTTNPFYQYIETAYSHNIISGYSDNTFRPTNNVTRGQLAKIVVLSKGWALYTPSTPTFTDVPTQNPFYQYIETAYTHQIISGYTCGPTCLEFRPGNNATRGQISKIVYNAITTP